ncbi:MAG: DUF1735 domain-containing protein [Gammaproteobacteria bacterium]|nr:MAG: DUF1735 domain-containing protein [Gammaproteobacteria bacterium]
MKKVSLLLSLSVVSLAMITGCLKDKGFEDQKYGIQIQSDRAVSFPQAPTGITVSVNSQSTAQTLSGPAVAREADDNGSQEVKVTIQENNALVTAAGLTALPSGSYTLSPSPTVVIPAGKTVSDQLKITFNNTSTLDPNKTYGIGISIASADGGYKIASNLKNVLITINIKNKYDGKYTLKGQFYHPTVANRGFFTFSVEMQTSGPNSVKMFWPLADAYAHGWTAGGTPTFFGLQEPEYTVDPVTNKVTVQNVAAGATTFYTMAPGYNSRYDPATKTIYAKWGYNYAPGPTFDPAANREWTDTLIYVGPR